MEAAPDYTAILAPDAALFPRPSAAFGFPRFNSEIPPYRTLIPLNSLPLDGNF